MLQKLLFLPALLVGVSFSFAQIVDINHNDAAAFASEEIKTPRLFGSGFIDYYTDGNIQASVQFLKLNFGNPKGFNVPFYIYTGASGESFSSGTLNSTTVSNLLNQIGGIVNGSLCKTFDVVAPKEYLTLRTTFQLGFKYLNGIDSLNKENVNFNTAYANFGFLFQTSAWANDEKDNLGIFWVMAKGIATMGSEDTLNKVFLDLDSNYFLGYTVDAGIEINKVINVKLGVYQYLNNQEENLLTKPIVKLSVDYALKRN